jgi:protein involved in polysaccharide export with SLBB domain
MGDIPKFMQGLGRALCAMVLAASCLSTAQAEDYKLGVQDRLRIHVSEWPALNGEAVVGANGEISLPVIGQIQAATLDTAELARSISQRLKEVSRLPELPDTSVDIIAYRPFYILGSVTTPGEYQYRPGMMVLNALSIAGGAYRSERFSAWDAERVSISSRGEIAVLALRREDLRAEKMRLNAQQEGLEEFPVAPADAGAQLLRALEEQRRIFNSTRERQDLEKASLTRSIEAREKEIAALGQQMADVARKRAATETELEQVRGLAKRNLAVHRLFPLERTLADVLREQQELEIRKLTAEQSLAEQRRELGNFDDRRRNEVVAEIQRVNAQIREVEQQQRALQRLLDGAAQYSSQSAEDDAENDEPQLRYVIVRTEGDKVQEIEAAETTRVKPGDIVKVFRVSESTVTGAVKSGAAPASGSTAPIWGLRKGSGYAGDE